MVKVRLLDKIYTISFHSYATNSNFCTSGGWIILEWWQRLPAVASSCSLVDDFRFPTDSMSTTHHRGPWTLHPVPLVSVVTRPVWTPWIVAPLELISWDHSSTPAIRFVAWEALVLRDLVQVTTPLSVLERVCPPPPLVLLPPVLL